MLNTVCHFNLLFVFFAKKIYFPVSQVQLLKRMFLLQLLNDMTTLCL